MIHNINNKIYYSTALVIKLLLDNSFTISYNKEGITVIDTLEEEFIFTGSDYIKDVLLKGSNLYNSDTIEEIKNKLIYLNGVRYSALQLNRFKEILSNIKIDETG